MAGLFNNNGTTVTTGTESQEGTIVTTSASGVFGSSTASAGTPATPSGIVVEDNDAGLFNGATTVGITTDAAEPPPVTVNEGRSIGIFGEGGSVNVLEGGIPGAQGPIGPEGPEGPEGPRGLPGGPGNDVISDWRGDLAYVDNQVAVLEESGVNNLYRATEAIPRSITTPAVAEQGTITVDNTALVFAGDPGSPEIVTLSVSGNTGADNFGPTTTTIDVTNGGTITLNVTPPSYPLRDIDFIDEGSTRITFSSNGTNENITIGFTTRRQLFNVNNRAEAILGLSALFGGGQLIATGTPSIDFSNVAMVVNNFRANPDNSTDILFDIDFTGTFTGTVGIPPQSTQSFIVRNNFTLHQFTNVTPYNTERPSQLRIITGSTSEVLDLMPNLSTPAAISADIVRAFNANSNLRSVFDMASVNAMDQVVFQTTANGDIQITISEIPNSGTLDIMETFMNGASARFIAPILRLNTPSDAATFSDIALQSSIGANDIATAIGNTLGTNGYTVTVMNNIVSYTRDLAGVSGGITLAVMTQGSSNLVDSQFTLAVTRIGSAAVIGLNNPPNVDTMRWELIASGGGAADGNTTYTFADGTNGTFTVTPSDTNLPQTVTVGAQSVSSVDVTFDTSNRDLTVNVDGVSDTVNIPGGGSGTTITGTGGIIDGGTLGNLLAIIDGGTLG